MNWWATWSPDVSDYVAFGRSQSLQTLVNERPKRRALLISHQGVINGAQLQQQLRISMISAPPLFFSFPQKKTQRPRVASPEGNQRTIVNTWNWNCKSDCRHFIFFNKKKMVAGASTSWRTWWCTKPCAIRLINRQRRKLVKLPALESAFSPRGVCGTHAIR